MLKFSWPRRGVQGAAHGPPQMGATFAKAMGRIKDRAKMVYRKIVIILIAAMIPIAAALFKGDGSDLPCPDRGEWVTAGE